MLIRELKRVMITPRNVNILYVYSINDWLIDGHTTTIYLHGLFAVIKHTETTKPKKMNLTRFKHCM